MTLNKVTLTLIAQPYQNEAVLRQVNATAHFKFLRVRVVFFRVRVISGTNLISVLYIVNSNFSSIGDTTGKNL